MRSFTLFIFLLSFIFSFSQNSQSWNVYHNGRKLLTGYDSFKENKYVVDIKSHSLDSAGFFIVECIGMDASIKGWALIRIIEIAVKKYYSIYLKDSTNKFEIDNVDLKKWFSRGKKLYIYTWSYPPRESGIKFRIRKIHLCTLRLR